MIPARRGKNAFTTGEEHKQGERGARMSAAEGYSMTDLEKARAYFAGDLYATETTGIVIEAAAEHYAKCSLTLTKAHCNALGRPMGGAIFTLADFAFAVAANLCPPGSVSLTSQITYLAPARGAVLTAEAHMIKSGRTTCFYQVDVTDEQGTRVAFVTVSGAMLRQQSGENG